MTKRGFRVRATDHSGYTHTLRTGFATREQAEDHPVVARHWSKIWIEPETEAQKAPDILPPDLPWTVEWLGGYAYAVDAHGKKIMSLLGPQKTREAVATILMGLKAK